MRRDPLSCHPLSAWLFRLTMSCQASDSRAQCSTRPRLAVHGAVFTWGFRVACAGSEPSQQYPGGDGKLHTNLSLSQAIQSMVLQTQQPAAGKSHTPACAQ
jgi:hypothetical protein